MKESYRRTNDGSGQEVEPSTAGATGGRDHGHCPEAERWKLNARRMALLAEAFVYEPRRITEGGLIAQVHRILTDQDVEWIDE